MSTGMSPSHVSTDQWPGRMAELCQSWKSAGTVRERDRVLAELWLLLNAVLARYIRIHSQTYGFLDPEDIRDIASEKALAYLRGLEGRAREDVGGEHPARICSYLSTLARNGLVDMLRKQGRSRAQRDEILRLTQTAGGAASAELDLQGEQFSQAIAACLDRVTPRARSAWFLRVFLDMPSKAIASHPNVRMTSTGVDMLLSRTRSLLRDCMKRKGFDAEDVPRGTFVTLWDRLHNGSGNTGRRSDGE